MSDLTQGPLRRVLIASANPLFARALRSLVAQRWEGRRVEVRMASSTDEATAILDSWQPDLVILDYDDLGEPGSNKRAAFLSHFITGERPMQVMLVSLRESGEVVVYDRRTLTPAQAEDWLDLPWTQSPAPEDETGQPPAEETPSPESIRPARTGAGTENLSSLRSGGMKHYVIAGVLTVIVTVVMYLLLQAIGFLPIAAAVQAGPVDRMIETQLWMISFLFSLITVFIGYSIVVFRQKKGEKEEGAFFKGSSGLEVLWTLFPLATVIYLSFVGAQALGEVRAADPNALEIRVVAFQWGWLFEYPETGVQSNELYMPVNRHAKLMLTSRDVIHSFWVPEFRIKQDALPGENLVREMQLTPTEIGDYMVRCAELCGGNHAYMNAPVRVVSQEDFDAWMEEQMQISAADPAERGRRLAETQGCIGCHSLDGSTNIGPTWQNLASSEVTLADGSTEIADDEYLYGAIVDPNAAIREGFPPNVMPQNYDEMFTEEQINDLIEFIETVH